MMALKSSSAYKVIGFLWQHVTSILGWWWWWWCGGGGLWWWWWCNSVIGNVADDDVVGEDNYNDDVMMMVVMLIIAFLRHQVDVDALVAFTHSWWSMWEHFLISWGSLSYVLSTGNLFFFVVITKSIFLKLQVWWFQTETVQRYNRLEIERVYTLSIWYKR